MTSAQQNKVNDVAIAVANAGGKVEQIRETPGAQPVVVLDLSWSRSLKVEKVVIVLPNGEVL